MLTCVYHPIHGMQVLEECDAETLVDAGFWFHSPKEATNYRVKVEEEIKQSRKVGRPKRVKEE